MISVAYLIVGVLVGICSGVVGIGGGTLIVPILIFIFGFTQHTAQGTSLALLLPPIGMFAVWTYYSQGYVNVPAALFIALGFLVGGLIGARIAVHLPALLLQRIFGFTLLIIAVQMLIGKR